MGWGAFLLKTCKRRPGQEKAGRGEGWTRSRQPSRKGGGWLPGSHLGSPRQRRGAFQLPQCAPNWSKEQRKDSEASAWLGSFSLETLPKPQLRLQPRPGAWEQKGGTLGEEQPFKPKAPQCPLKGEWCPPDQLTGSHKALPGSRTPAKEGSLSSSQEWQFLSEAAPSPPKASLAADRCPTIPGFFSLSPGLKVWAHLCHYLHPGGSSHKHPWLSSLAERAFVSVTSASPGRPGGQKRSIPEPPGMLSVLGRPSETFLPTGGQAGHPLLFQASEQILSLMWSCHQAFFK